MSVVLPLIHIKQRSELAQSNPAIPISTSLNGTPKAKAYKFKEFTPKESLDRSLRKSLDRLVGTSSLENTPTGISPFSRKRNYSDYKFLSAQKQRDSSSFESQSQQASMFAKPSRFMPSLETSPQIQADSSRKSKPNLVLQTFQHMNSFGLDVEITQKMKDLKESRASGLGSNNSSFHLTQLPEQTKQQLKLTSVLGLQKQERNSEQYQNQRSPSHDLLLSPLSPSPKKNSSSQLPHDNQQYHKRTSRNTYNKFSFEELKLFGEEALRDSVGLKFNLNYKNVEKIVAIDTHFQNESSISVRMLKETIGKNVLPRKLGIIRQSLPSFVFPKANAKQKLDLSNQNIANRYHEMISSALSHGDMQSLFAIDLSSNNLSGNSLKIIAKNLSTGITKVNLDKNSLGPACAHGIIPLLDTNIFINLRVLSLENNNLSDLGLNFLVSALTNNRSIYRLNLSSNRLTDVSGEVIKAYLTQSSYLQELYLHWNKISSSGALAIAQGLSDNRILQVKIYFYQISFHIYKNVNYEIIGT